MLIKPDSRLITDNNVRLISTYRINPILAANKLLIRNGQPVTLPLIQQKVLLEWWSSNFSVLTATRGYGKLLSNDTKVLTPEGFRRIDTLREGDAVITPKGKVSTITGVFPEENPKLFEITFADGRKCKACEDHQWFVKNQYKEGVLTTKECLKLLEFGAAIYIPTVEFNPSNENSGGEVKVYNNDKLDKVKQDLWSRGYVLEVYDQIDDIGNNFKQVIYYTHSIGLEIKDITPIPSESGRCLAIDDPESLYVIDDYVVTHNTFLAALYLTLRLMLFPGSQICIFAPSFRQSKLIFAEFQKFYYESRFLQECMAKEPSIQTDQAIAVTKRIGKIRPSTLKALPVGNDGAKIRGERAQLILMDEIAQLPEHIYTAAIRPILSTDMDPMSKVMKTQKLIEQYGSLENIPDSELANANSYVGITSGYYQFNYWWRQICNFYHNIKKGDKAYNLNFVPYTDLPPGFLDMKVIEDARQSDPDHVFKTEWCAEWVGDSAGAFPMSLLDSCRDKSVIPTDVGDPSGKSQYVFGVDVARERDATAIVVVKLGYPNHVVHLAELEETPFPEQAQHLLDLIGKFNPIKIFMDAGGGGSSLKDYLLDPQSVGRSPSLKTIEEDALAGVSGRRVLKMINFTPTIWTELNNNTKTLLEQRALLLPDSTNPIESNRSMSVRKKNKKTVDLVQIMINQIASIVITPKPSGALHYDLPKNSSSSGYQNKSNLQVRRKDLYTAFVLAGCCAYELSFKHIDERRLVSHGIIKEHDPLVAMGHKNGVHTISTSRLPSRSTILPEDVEITNNRSKSIIPQGGIIIKGGSRNKYDKKRRR